MSLISPEVAKQVQQALKGMQSPVKLHVFTEPETSTQECEYCEQTRELIGEVAALDDRLSVEFHDFTPGSDLTASLKIDKTPAVAIMRNQGEQEEDFGIRLYGIPAGYEFSTLIEDLLIVSSAKHGLSEKTLRQIERLDRPVHIQVYVTPT